MLMVLSKFQHHLNGVEGIAMPTIKDLVVPNNQIGRVKTYFVLSLLEECGLWLSFIVFAT